MDDTTDQLDALLRSGARRLTGHQRRLFQAEVTAELCGGSPRVAERRFGWGRNTVAKGLKESRHGIRCLENFAARGRVRSEDKDPQLAADIRAIVEPHSYVDPELKSSRRYSNLSAKGVRDALIAKGHSPARLPSERTLRDILNRMNYRLKRIQKGKPLKQTATTDAIFENVKRVREESKNDPHILEISMEWNGVLLTTLLVVLGCAQRMTWKGQHPIVRCLGGKYPSGVRVAAHEMKSYEARLQRSRTLPKYDVTILPRKLDRQVK